MKKIFYCTLSVAFLALTITSCGKTTKGKLANDWKITESKETITDTDTDGDKTLTTILITETTYTRTTGSSVQMGQVNANEMTIDKDGTWTHTEDMTFSGAIMGGSVFVSAKTTTITSGTWSFVGQTKGDDFKKNERILFNTLSETRTTINTGSTPSPTTTSSSKTYLTGENKVIYTVKESSSKELQLEAEIGNQNTTDGSITSSTGMKTITLTAK